MKKTNVRNLSVILLAAIVAANLVGQAVAQQQRSSSITDSKTSLLLKGEKVATARCEAVVKVQREKLAFAGTRTRFREFAGGVIDWEEKFAQGNDAFRSGDNSMARMQTLFRKHILDEMEFSKQLADGYMKLQGELIVETLETCRIGGVAREDVIRTINVWELNKGAWSRVFEYVPRRAAALSKTDWFREILEFAGSDIAADVVEDTARGVGLWNHKEGSWGDLIAKFTTQLIVEKVIAEVTDPVGEVAKRLQSDFEQCSKVVIDGKHGFREACAELTQHHIDCRRKLLGLTGKAVKK